MRSTARGDETVETRRSMGGRLLGGAAATAVIGATLFMGGIASFVVASAHHITSTTPITTGSVVGSAVLEDSATLGATTTDRHVEFFLWAPGSSNCTGTPVLTDLESVTTAQGNGTVPVVTSKSYTASVVGTYQWTAEIIAPGGAVEWPTTGTPNQCGLEPAVITAASPAINTTPTRGGPVGTIIGDSATVTGGFQPTGTVGFKLYPPSEPTCDGSPVSSSTAALSNGKATSGTFATTAVGTYRWTANYSGDSNNKPAVSGCTAEQVVVTQADPAITTTPSKGGVTGTAISDSATVSGGNAPTGSVTFKLYGPTATTCAGTPLFTSTIALTKATVGSGSFSGTSTVGTYSWTAAYSGDANNAAASSTCKAETVVITSPPSTPTPTPTPGGVLAITTPSTGASGSALMLTIGGFMFLGGAGVALLGVAAPRRRRNILL
jgi:hypothetical protein